MVNGATDLPDAHAFQDKFLLSLQDGSPAHRKFDVGMQPGEFVGDPARYVEVVKSALRENPPPANEAALVNSFAQVGLGTRDTTTELRAGQLQGIDLGLNAVLEEIGAPQPSALGGGWFLPVEVSETYGTDYFIRAQVARNYIGALGIEEAMYIMADCDSDGAPLNGKQAYELHFPPGGLPLVGAFWSITMYDKADCMLVENPLNRYSIGDRSPTLRYEPDGGLRLLFSAIPPTGSLRRDNWLPAPDRPFYLTLRLYMPQAPHLDRTFVYPSLTRLPTTEQ
jgi:hypothetical protein